MSDTPAAPRKKADPKAKAPQPASPEVPKQPQVAPAVQRRALPLKRRSALDQVGLDAVCQQIEAGQPLELALNVALIDKDSLHGPMRRAEAKSSDCTEWDTHVLLTVRQSEAVFMGKKIAKLLTGTKDERDAARTYIELFRPVLNHYQKVRLSYELRVIAKHVREVVGDELYFRVMERLATMDPEAAIMEQDEAMAPHLPEE